MRVPRRGAVAIAVAVVLVIIDLIIVGMVFAGSRGHDLTVRRLETVQAFYAAEAGINMAIHELLNDQDQDGDCGIGTISHDGDVGNDPSFGRAQFIVTVSSAGMQATVISHGRSGEARRDMVAVIDLSAGAITYDNASSSETGSTTLTFSHTIGSGTNRLLVVAAAVEGSLANAEVTSVTYNSIAMTKAIDHAGSGASVMNCELWYMLDAGLPAAGTYNVEIITVNGGEVVGGATSVFGAAQQGPEATAVNDDGDAGDSSISTNITTLTDGAWIFEVVGSGDPHTGFTPDSGQTEHFDELGGSNRGAGSTEPKTSAGLESQQWSTESSSNRLTHVLAAWPPA